MDSVERASIVKEVREGLLKEQAEERERLASVALVKKKEQIAKATESRLALDLKNKAEVEELNDRFKKLSPLLAEQRNERERVSKKRRKELKELALAKSRLAKKNHDAMVAKSKKIREELGK